jgi:hypothetical protein
LLDVWNIRPNIQSTNAQRVSWRGALAMRATFDRRNLMLGAGSTALLGALPRSAVQAFSLGDALTGLGVAVFPPAAAALAGFGLVKTVDLVSNLDSLVDQTKNLETHIDQVLTQVSTILSTVQKFVQDADKALQEIEDLIKQLPEALVAAFDKIATQTALAKLRAAGANMSGYLHSKNSIIDNSSRIRDLCDEMVNEIIAVDTLEKNMFQFIIQTVPGLTTWMQGYTAYNLTLEPDRRLTNPWDHQVVSSYALPKFISVIQSVKGYRGSEADIASRIPLDSKVLYTFDGAKFSKADRAFAITYPIGTIDNGYYYTIWPDGVTWQGPPLPPQPPGAPPPRIISPQAGDFCYLIMAPERFWMIAPAAGFILPPPPVQPGMPPPPFWPPPDFAAAQRASATYPRLLSTALKTTVAFDQLTDGWQIFEKSTDANLAQGDRDLWSKMPRLT